MLKPLYSYYHHLERRMDLKQKVSQALAYPFFLIATFTVILGLMFVFVVPNFTGMYEDLAVEMPVITVWLLSFVEYLPVVASVIAALTAAILVFIRYMATKPDGRERLDAWKEKLPFWGTSYRLFTYWQFSQSLASLLNGGSSLLTAIKTHCDIGGNKHFASHLRQVAIRVSNGESLAAALGAERCYPSKSLKMISVGEEASNLEMMLWSIAKYYERQLDDQIKKTVSLIEPLVMLMIGLVIGVVIVALYLPVFGMVNVIG